MYQFGECIGEIKSEGVLTIGKSDRPIRFYGKRSSLYTGGHYYDVFTIEVEQISPDFYCKSIKCDGVRYRNVWELIKALSGYRGDKATGDHTAAIRQLRK